MVLKIGNFMWSKITDPFPTQILAWKTPSVSFSWTCMIDIEENNFTVLQWVLNSHMKKFLYALWDL